MEYTFKEIPVIELSETDSPERAINFATLWEVLLFLTDFVKRCIPRFKQIKISIKN